MHIVHLFCFMQNLADAGVNLFELGNQNQDNLTSLLGLEN